MENICNALTYLFVFNMILECVNYAVKVPPIAGTRTSPNTGPLFAIEGDVRGAIYVAKTVSNLVTSALLIYAFYRLYRKMLEHMVSRLRTLEKGPFGFGKETNRRYQKAIEHLESSPPADDLPYSQRCVVCQYYARDIVLLPCRHFCLCKACLVLTNEHCPICRAGYKSAIAVYVS